MQEDHLIASLREGEAARPNPLALSPSAPRRERQVEWLTLVVAGDVDVRSSRCSYRVRCNKDPEVELNALVRYPLRHIGYPIAAHELPHRMLVAMVRIYAPHSLTHSLTHHSELVSLLTRKPKTNRGLIEIISPPIQKRFTSFRRPYLTGRATIGRLELPPGVGRSHRRFTAQLAVPR